MATYSWPSSGGTAGSNPSVSTNGQAIPSSSTLVAGQNPSGNLNPLQTDANGFLYVSLSGSGVTPIPVSQSGTWNITNITGTVSLPTGASTSALQTSGNTSLVTIASNQTNGTQVTAVNNFPATQPISGTVAATQSGTWNITNISGTVSLPTGAATSANQTNGTQLTGLVAGTAVVGKVGIDQTTPGTTNGVQVNAALPAGTNTLGTVLIKATDGTLTDNSGSTSGTPSTSTQIMGSNATRKYLLIQNSSTTATIWINFNSAATAGSGSFQLLPGGSIVQEDTFVSSEAINVLSTTASVPYTAKQG